MRWPRDRERRLARVEAGLARDMPAAASRRCAAAARAKLVAMIRESLAGSAIDPADLPALRVADAADINLGQHGPAAPEHRLIARILDIAARYRDGSAPDPGHASLAELFAWCLARGDQPAGESE